MNRKILLNFEVELTLDDINMPVVISSNVTASEPASEGTVKATVDHDTSTPECSREDSITVMDEHVIMTGKPVTRKLDTDETEGTSKPAAEKLIAPRIKPPKFEPEPRSKNRWYPKRVTFKSQILDFVDENGGSCTWKEIHNFMTTSKGIGPSDSTNRGFGSGYFSGQRRHNMVFRPYGTRTRRGEGHSGCLTYPSSNDPRYIMKDGNRWILHNNE